jgi:hypothetical protein
LSVTVMVHEPTPAGVTVNVADFVFPAPETLCDPGLTLAMAGSLEEAVSVPPPVCEAENVWLRAEPVPVNCSCAGETASVWLAALSALVSGMTGEPPELAPPPPHAASSSARDDHAAILGRACIAMTSKKRRARSRGARLHGGNAAKRM